MIAQAVVSSLTWIDPVTQTSENQPLSTLLKIKGQRRERDDFHAPQKGQVRAAHRW